MNKTAIKNFAIWARNKLIDEITYKAGLLGITEKEIKSPLHQSTETVKFFDIGTNEPYAITGGEIEQRRKLANEIEKKAKQSDYKTAYQSVVDEVAYTWFNRLIAVRFMEVNDYLPTRIRVLSSESSNKSEPDLVTDPMNADLDYTAYDKDCIMQLKNNNQLDELFRMLFIKQCNALNAILPGLFEKTNDYTELLMNVSFTDQDSVVYHLVHDISEDDFNVSKEGQVEIIGWMYQYYNSEVFNQVYDGSMSKKRVTADLLPAATQLFTPDWAVKYMVQNSLREYASKDFNEKFEYYINDNQSVANNIDIESLKVIDPCMGSGHILVCVFDTLMKMYLFKGYEQREAAKLILQNNLYGLDIDKRAYQLAYFSIFMKARQYNRRIFKENISLNICSITDSNNYDGDITDEQFENENQTIIDAANYLIKVFKNGSELGSLLKVERKDYDALEKKIFSLKDMEVKDFFEYTWISQVLEFMPLYIKQAKLLSNKYDVIITNPPYLGSGRMSVNLVDYIEKYYSDSKADLAIAMFQAVSTNLLKKNGHISFITTISWMVLKSFEKIRKNILANMKILSMVDFGTELFEGKVGHLPIIAWVCQNTKNISTFKAVRLVEYCYGRRCEKEKEFFNKNNRYIVEQNTFHCIPGSPIAYWADDKIFGIYKQNIHIGNNVESKAGVVTGNDEYFIRMWYEINYSDISFKGKEKGEYSKYHIFQKGGPQVLYYGNEMFVIKLKDLYNPSKTNKSVRRGDYNYYYKKAIGWSYIGMNNIKFRVIENSVCATQTPTIYIKDNEEYYYVLGLLNSKIASHILKILNPTISVLTSDICNIPLIFKKDEQINEIVKENIDIARENWNYNETSWDFKCNPLINIIKEKYNGEKFDCKIADIYVDMEIYLIAQNKRFRKNQALLNQKYLEIYNLNEDNLKNESGDYDTLNEADLTTEIKNLIFYAVGCAFGRYSLDVDRIVSAGGGLNDSKYNIFIPHRDNILHITDEEYFKDDIVGLICTFLKKTFGSETLEENLDFISNNLGYKGNSSREIIRNYFLKGFFKDHCKIYQKRPIYWLFDSGKADGFKALVYMHRYNADTIGNLRIDYLHRMQHVYESEISRMQETIDNSKDAREMTAATKRKEKLVKQLKETKEYDEKIAHLALARIAIDLDDGVKINYEKVQTDTDGKKLEVLAKI